MAYPLNTNRITKPAEHTGSPLSGISSQSKSSGGSLFKNVITLVIVLAILGGGVYLIGGAGSLASLLPGGALFHSDWQAIFLSNGQVYFGKVKNPNANFVLVTDIYYLQVTNVDKSALGQPPDVQTQPEQRLTLIKLGNEIHGPMDTMLINRSQVVLIEDLKSDSRVVQAINDYLAGKTAPAETPKK